MLHRLAREDVRTSLLSCRIAREGFRSSSAKEDRQSGCESFPCVSQTEAENEFIEHAKAIRLHPDRNDRRYAHHRHTDSAFYGRCYKRLRSCPENAGQERCRANCSAINAFYTEYGRYPVTLTSTTTDAFVGAGNPPAGCTNYTSNDVLFN